MFGQKKGFSESSVSSLSSTWLLPSSLKVAACERLCTCTQKVRKPIGMHNYYLLESLSCSLPLVGPRDYSILCNTARHSIWNYKYCPVTSIDVTGSSIILASWDSVIFSCIVSNRMGLVKFHKQWIVYLKISAYGENGREFVLGIKWHWSTSKHFAWRKWIKKYWQLQITNQC